MSVNGAILAEALGFGILSSAVIAVAAVGFTLQFGISNILNLAYASVMTLSMFVAYLARTAGLGIWEALALAGVFGAVTSYLVNAIVYRPFARRTSNLFSIILVTLATALVLTNLLEGLVGERFFSYALPPSGGHAIGSFHFTNTQLAVFAIGVVAMAAVQVLLQATPLGRAMRATAADRELAATCGIPTERVTDAAWLVSGLLCGLGGVALALDLGDFTPTTGGDFLVIVIAAAVLGGIGRPVGAMAGALIVSIVSELVAVVVDPVYKTVAGLALLVVVLLFRPQGIVSLGRARAG